MIKELKADIRAFRDRDPAARTDVEVALLYPGLHALWGYRIAHWLYNRHLSFIARLLSSVVRCATGIDIHPGAVVGVGLVMDHGVGIVIGETAIIGDNVSLFQGVTLGGTGKETGQRHPIVQDGVLISAGAIVLGPITIGSNSKIGAGSVVVHDVPPNSTAVGVPARVVRHNGYRVSSSDHSSLPDPLFDTLSSLVAKIDILQRDIEDLRDQVRNGREKGV